MAFLITHHPQLIPKVEQTVKNQCVGVFAGGPSLCPQPLSKSDARVADALKDCVPDRNCRFTGTWDSDHG